MTLDHVQRTSLPIDKLIQNFVIHMSSFLVPLDQQAKLKQRQTNSTDYTYDGEIIAVNQSSLDVKNQARKKRV
jgi:hypothetical protein